MKTIRIRYLLPLPLRQDMQRVFPQWGRKEDGTFDAALAKDDISDATKKRHAFVKIVRNVNGTLKHLDVYALVRDSFTPPLWLQGIVTPHTTLDPFTHVWQGHEVKVDDAANEAPDNEIIT